MFSSFLVEITYEGKEIVAKIELKKTIDFVDEDNNGLLDFF